MKIFCRIFVLFSLAAFAVSCGSKMKNEDSVQKLENGIESQNKKFIAKLEWLSPLKASEYLDARLTVSTMNHAAPAAVAVSKFDPQMPSMGHGTAVDEQTITQDPVNAAVFNILKVFFIMGGPWEIYVTVKVDEIEDVVTIPVDIP